ncbi:MAG: nuclear transport factor 2 family protein [Planctomycetia bacterium]
MHDRSFLRRFASGHLRPWLLAALASALPLVATSAASAADQAVEIIAAVKKAADAYEKAFNAGDDKALADQWTLGAELTEGSGSLKGREAIIASLKQWRGMHPKAAVKIDVTDVEPLGEGVARVRGTLAFTKNTDEEPAVSRFDSLRVLENGIWRIAESRVVPTPKAVLTDLAWMLGTWQAADARTGTTIDATYEKSLNGHAIVGRVKVRRKDGSTVESIDVIHPDRLTGRVRSWSFDSTGAHAEGELSSDGVSFDRRLVGTPGDPALGDRAEWTQVLTPLGRDMLLWHSIERTIDGRSQPDSEPVHLRRIR